MMSQTGEMSDIGSETRLALIHRVIVTDEDYPKEYAILVTDRRSIFIRQKKTRSSFVLRYEMRIGTALVTDLTPKTLEDYEQTSLEALTADDANLTIPHEAVISLVLNADEPEHRRRDFFLWLTMKRQGEIFQVYNFEMNYRLGSNQDAKVVFYLVPLGAYFKPRRQNLNRETVLRQYAADGLEIFQRVMPAKIVSRQMISDVISVNAPNPNSARTA